MENRRHPLCVLESLRAADAPRVELEIAPSDLEREGPPCQIEFDQAVLHLPGELRQDLYHAVPVHEVALEGNLLPNRLAFPCGFDRPVILAAHRVIELDPLFPKERPQTLFAQALEISPVCYAQFLSFAAVTLPTPMNLSIGSASRKAEACSGEITVRPSGLWASDASFARNLQ